MFSQYKPVVDFFKILSSFAIIWFHSPVQLGNKIAYSGLLFFITFSVFLLLTKSQQGYSFYKLYKRYLWPWFFWLVIYGLGNLLLSKSFLIQTDNILYSILAGSHYHLWYLPYMFMALVLLDVCKPYIKINLFVFWVLLILWAATENVWRLWSISEGMPVSQYIHGFGAICIGILLSTPGIWSYNKSWNLLFVHSSIFIILLYLSFYTEIGLPYFIGISFVYMSVFIKSNFIPRSVIQAVKMIAKLTFGIYLIHPVFIYFLQSYVHIYFLPVMVFMSSILFIYFLRLTFPKLASHIM